jgi:hypothetical protein
VLPSLEEKYETNACKVGYFLGDLQVCKPYYINAESIFMTFHKDLVASLVLELRSQ